MTFRNIRIEAKLLEWLDIVAYVSREITCRTLDQQTRQAALQELGGLAYVVAYFWVRALDARVVDLSSARAAHANCPNLFPTFIIHLKLHVILQLPGIVVEGRLHTWPTFRGRKQRCFREIRSELPRAPLFYTTIFLICTTVATCCSSLITAASTR